MAKYWGTNRKQKNLYTVKAGDTWLNMAEKLKSGASTLAKANMGISQLRAGQVIKVPKQLSAPVSGSTYGGIIKGGVLPPPQQQRQPLPPQQHLPWGQYTPMFNPTKPNEPRFDTEFPVPPGWTVVNGQIVPPPNYSTTTTPVTPPAQKYQEPGGYWSYMQNIELGLPTSTILGGGDPWSENKQRYLNYLKRTGQDKRYQRAYNLINKTNELPPPSYNEGGYNYPVWNGLITWRY